MRNRHGFLALALALVLGACGGGGGADPAGPGGDPPPASCGAPLSQCATSADCCASCLAGYCLPSPAGGKCVTTEDCIEPNVCVSRACAAASCRQDLDVCTTHAQCCGGHCRGGGTCGPNRPPVANAGPDATVDKGQPFAVGGHSSDPDGDPLDFAWTLARPPGSAASFADPTATHPSFVPDLAGVYTVSVTVTDGQYSASDSRVVTAVNSAPVARAGSSRSAPRNTLVQLDGSASSDPNGDPITLAWSLAGPAGSTAALSSPTDPRPTFTPDRLGDYVVTLLAGDGELSGSASVTVTSVNTPPVARVTGFGAVNAGEALTLDATASTDANGDPLSFTWALSGPAGSAAALSAAAGPTTSFTADLPGSYAVTLSASDGIDTRTARHSVQAHPAMTKLAHDVVDAAYARTGDRLVTVSASPANALWILDPATGVERRVDLSAGPPLSVAVSLDGAVAVVGRNGGVTEVDLASGTVRADCQTRWSDGTVSHPYDAASVAVGAPVTLGNGGNARTTRFAYAAPGNAADRGDYVLSLDLGTCASAADWVMGPYFDGSAAMQPVTGRFWVHDDASTFATYWIYSTQAGSLSARVTAEPGWDTRRDFWFTEDGGRFLAQSGEVYDTVWVETPWAEQLTRLGALGNPGVYEPRRLVLHADHSTARREFSIVPMNDWDQVDADTVLERYATLSQTGYPASGSPVTLPRIVLDGAPWVAHGRFVFYRSDGSARYAIVRTPPGASPVVHAVAPMAP